VVAFPHRDLEGLVAVLSTDLGARQRPLAVSDGIFPITGALAPVPDYEVVLQPYDGALLCLYDAHAYGVQGDPGPCSRGARIPCAAGRRYRVGRRRRVKETADAAGDAVEHLGVQPPETVALILQCSDLFVLPSLFESLPLTMLEAAACGCPCPVSAVPTIRSWVPPAWVERGHFALIPPLATTDADVPVAADVPRFIDAIAAGIAGMLSRPRTDADQSDLASHLVPHSWSAVFAHYESIYRELIGEKRAKAEARTPNADGAHGEVVGQVVGADLHPEDRPVHDTERFFGIHQDHPLAVVLHTGRGGEEIADHPDACLRQQRAIHREPPIDTRGRKRPAEDNHVDGLVHDPPDAAPPHQPEVVAAQPARVLNVLLDRVNPDVP